MTYTDEGLIAGLRKEVEEAKVREVDLNRRFKYKYDYQKGSLVVSLRWDHLERILNLAEKGLANEPQASA